MVLSGLKAALLSIGLRVDCTPTLLFDLKYLPQCPPYYLRRDTCGSRDRPRRGRVLWYHRNIRRYALTPASRDGELTGRTRQPLARRSTAQQRSLVMST